MMKKPFILMILLFSVAFPLGVTASSFTTTFGNSPVSPANVGYAAYSFITNTNLYWPQFSSGQTNIVARFMNITTTASGLTISMPDATLQSVGFDTIIFNAGSNSFTISSFTGASIVTIAPGQTYYLMLNNNATQTGGWQTIQFGVGTGSANASALAGAGLEAVAGMLQVDLNANNVSSAFTITQSSLAQLYVWTGGAGTITLPAAASVGNGFFFLIANNGTGSLTLSASSGTIDGNSTSIYSTSQSGFIFSNGTNWFSVGKGIQNNFAVTLLNLNVAGNSNITETSAQAQNIIQVFTGTLTGNINVIVPAAVQLYEINNSSSGSYTITVKTASGTGVTVPQGYTSILYCDGTNVVNGFTASVASSISLLNGSAAGPSLYFSNYQTTGMYAPASNTIGFTAGANEVLSLSSTSSAVDYLNINASSSTNPVTITAEGTDATVGLNLIPLGTAGVTIGTTAVAPAGTGFDAAVRIEQLGAVQYPANYVPSCAPDCTYFVMDKQSDANDTSIVMRSGGNARAEIGIIGDDNIHFKTVAGSYGSEAFSDRMTILGTNSSNPGNVGIGTNNPLALLDVGSGLGQDVQIDYVGDVFLNNTSGSPVLSITGQKTSGSGPIIKLKNGADGNVGYIGPDSGVAGGTAYHQIDVKAAQSDGTISLIGGGQSTPGVFVGTLNAVAIGTSTITSDELNVSGSVNATAYNLSGSPIAQNNIAAGAIVNGTTATTQTAGDTSTKIATDGFVNNTALTLANGTTATTQAANDSTTKVATDAFVNPGALVSANGYQKLSSGLIIQWGTFTTSSSGYTNLTFPLAWPTGIYSITGSDTSGESLYLVCVNFVTGSATTTTIPVAAYTNIGFLNRIITWIAIGH